MSTGQLGTVVRYLRRMARAPARGEPRDRHLLERFVTHREDAAFAALVERHGPMVLGVCQRVLQDGHDAEDAFQATFLVLARKAGAIRRQASVGSWLYGVAYRTSLRAKAQAARRRAREREASGMQPVPTCPAPAAESARQDLRPLIDAELALLPEKYRAPLVLCYLEGKTNTEAARQLGWSKGTVSGRLARARDVLRRRLARRGLAISAGALLLALSSPALAVPVPQALLSSTIQAATLSVAGSAAAGAATSTAASLAEGVLHMMFLTKLKLTTAIALLVILLTLGGFVAYHNLAGVAAAAERGGEGQKAAPGKSDRDRLQGTWLLIALEKGGAKVTDDEVKGMKIVFAGDKITVHIKGEAKEGTYKLNPDKNPKEIDIDLKEKNIGEGIYQLDQDELKLAIDDEGKRPTVFTTEDGKRHPVFLLKRQKNDKGAGNTRVETDAGKLREINERLQRELDQARDALDQARKQLAQERDLARQLQAEAEAQRRRAEQAFQQARRALDQALVEQQGAQEQARAAAQAEGQTNQLREAASVFKLRQIAIAFHNYHSVYHSFPSAAVHSKDGKALLSWRVLLLPYLEQDALFRQFKLDEPWDSPNNKKLLTQMPLVFVSPDGKGKDTHSTFYQVLTGKSTLFDGAKATRFADIHDGTSNTILAVEAGNAVPWTKPDDLAYDAGKPLPKLGGIFGPGFHVLWADGSVNFIRAPFNEQVLRQAITPRGNEIINRDDLTNPK